MYLVIPLMLLLAIVRGMYRMVSRPASRLVLKHMLYGLGQVVVVVAGLSVGLGIGLLAWQVLR